MTRATTPPPGSPGKKKGRAASNGDPALAATYRDEFKASWDATKLIPDLRAQLIAQLGLTAELARRALPSRPRSARKTLRGIDRMLRKLGVDGLSPPPPDRGQV